MAAYLKIDGDYTSQQRKYNPDGTVDLWIKLVDNGVAKTAGVITWGVTGYVFADLFDVAASASGTYFIGVPRQAQATNSFGWAQIGGPVADAEISTSTATSGHFFDWNATKLATTGGSLKTVGTVGVYTAAAVSGTTHDILLFDEQVKPIS